jgi:hypothetical protein
MNLTVGIVLARTDRPVVDQRAAGDHLRASGDRDLRVAETAEDTGMTRAQLGNLAGAAGRRILMAFAARLRVV